MLLRLLFPLSLVYIQHTHSGFSAYSIPSVHVMSDLFPHFACDCTLFFFFAQELSNSHLANESM